MRPTVRQRDVTCSSEALITVTDSLIPSTGSGVIDARGLPGYTFECASGELWRSRFDATRNVIVVNNGHRDFVFASRTQALKLRYLLRLYVKELVLRNFSGVPGDQLLERTIELSLYRRTSFDSSLMGARSPPSRDELKAREDPNLASDVEARVSAFKLTKQRSKMSLANRSSVREST
jgi:hypothetical protein